MRRGRAEVEVTVELSIPRRLRSVPLPDAEQFPQQVWELVGYLDGTLPDDHPFRKVRVQLLHDTLRPAVLIQVVVSERYARED